MSRLFTFFFLSMLFCTYTDGRYDVTVVGPIVYPDGLGRLAIGFIDSLKDDISINVIRTYGESLKDVPKKVRDIVNNPDRVPGRVSILYDVLWTRWATPAEKVPQSTIKVAYSMIESTSIPYYWVHLLNTQFDAVVVPDQFLEEVYRGSGVKIPLFVLPCGIYLEEFLKKPIKTKANTHFTFGISAGFFSDHKNHELVIDAFIQEFAYQPNVVLKVHGRIGDEQLQQKIASKVRTLKNSTITFINKNLTAEEYLAFMSSLDCYVLLSKGEGFSITPREAMALGIPCIISNNTAHKTICNTGLVRPVKSEIQGFARYPSFGSICGYNFTCTLEDARQALRDVYDNYNNYLCKAEQARAWVQQYTHAQLKDKYLALVKPKKVVFDTYNALEKECLITNSKALYDKYQHLIKTTIRYY